MWVLLYFYVVIQLADEEGTDINIPNLADIGALPYSRGVVPVILQVKICSVYIFCRNVKENFEIRENF